MAHLGLGGEESPRPAGMESLIVYVFLISKPQRVNALRCGRDIVVGRQVHCHLICQIIHGDWQNHRTPRHWAWRGSYLTQAGCTATVLLARTLSTPTSSTPTLSMTLTLSTDWEEKNQAMGAEEAETPIIGVVINWDGDGERYRPV